MPPQNAGVRRSSSTVFPRTQPGSTVRAPGQPNLTAFDPIKNHTGQKTSVAINGQRRQSIASRSGSNAVNGQRNRSLVVRASNAPSPRIPSINPLAAVVPSLPRRQYIPTVGEVPEPEQQ